MTVIEIPKAYLYTCDCCGITHRQENASGHYSNSRPSGWHRLKWDADALDYQGCAVGSAAFERLLCPDCGVLVRGSINKIVESRP